MTLLDPNKLDINTTVPTLLRSILQQLRALSTSSLLLDSTNWPWHFGWVQWKDVAGTITILGTGGTQVGSVGFRTGTLAGDYTLTLPTAMASTVWGCAGMGQQTNAGGTNANFMVQNGLNVSHTTTVLNFIMQDGAGNLQRPVEAFLIFLGTKA